MESSVCREVDCDVVVVLMSVGTAMEVGGASKDWRFRGWVLPRLIEDDGVSVEEAEEKTVARLVIVDNRLLPLVVLNGRFIVAIDVNNKITNGDTAFRLESHNFLLRQNIFLMTLQLLFWL